MKYFRMILMLVLVSTIITACKKYPIDEDNLLITTRQECYVSNFELLGSDYVTVITNTAEVDTVAQTIAVEVKYGTDLKNVYPQFTLAQDCKLNPKITGWTDFSDLTNPKKYTVISGDRTVRKEYTINITVKPL